MSADVWSLGISLWEAASGRYPFAADSVFAQLNAIVTAKVPPLPEGQFSVACQDFLQLWYLAL